MRPKLNRQEMGIDQIMAIGLVWGHLRARQFEEAFLLAKGCLRVWPDERNLILMHAYAAAEVLEPVDVDKLLSIRNAACEGWIRMVLIRAGLASLVPPATIDSAAANVPEAARKNAPAATPKAMAASVPGPAARAPASPRPRAAPSAPAQESRP